MNTHSASPRPAWAANLLALDYRQEARRFTAPSPITDIHIHINGPGAARIFKDVAALYGVNRFLTQTRLDDASAVSEIFGNHVDFVAVPNWMQPDKSHAFRQGFLDQISTWHERWGARMIKLWAAPRLWEILGADATDIVPIDSEWRIRHAELAVQLGMMIMTHTGDPDTWFKTRYADATIYRKKRGYYIGLERMLDRFGSTPWIAAHMGGYPEDLDFLSGMLERHDNLHLDTSATKWIVREISQHPPEKVRDFLERWRGRIFFGSDIVTLEDHLAPRETPSPTTPMSDLATSPDQAFELYASRYWALRTMFETEYDGRSPIADPDLAMVEPGRSPLDSPRLRGLSLPPDLLQVLYHDAAENVVYKWLREQR